MKILIINGYPRTPKGLHSFDEFHWAIKKLLAEQKEFIDIETEYITREKNNIDDFLYEPDSGYAKVESAKLFDHLDMIFICGDSYLLPWHSSAKNLVLLIRMCLRVNKIVFLSSFAMHVLIFLCATNFEKNINVINGDGKGGKLGDLTNLSKHFSQINNNDFFLDHVTGDLYSYNFDKNEWTAKANTGIHYEKAAQEYYTLGKFIINTPPYRVKSLNSLENIFISKNTEAICYLKKSHLNHYLFQGVPFEFLIPNKSSWIIHTFSFINNKKGFLILADTKKGACIIELKNCIAAECEISEKYHCTIQILRNFILHHLKLIKAFARNSELSIINYYYKSCDIMHEDQINKKKLVFFEKRRKINFDVFVEAENSTKNYEEITRFHHVGYSATKKFPLYIEKNTILDKNFKSNEKKSKTTHQSNFVTEVPINSDFIKTEENFRDIDKNEESFKINLTKSKIRQLLHPNLSDQCLKEDKFWVPGNLSKKIFKEIDSSKKNSSTGFVEKVKNIGDNSIYNHRFREESKINWIGENFKFSHKK